ncbi:FAD-dependent oxidoreductase [Streptomyces sp. NPDC051907]|uniref:flavin monoamine oxidase family protein n=1 Tax=Streptomyces sp. NPDC051907 TaxID=3155284 RepID=UPI0034464479
MSVEEPANKDARALYRAMIGACGPEATGWTGSTGLTGSAPEGASVVVLGGGIGGLTAAYELSKRGYRCTVLEPQTRAGGRNRTARAGDRLYEIGASGQPVLTHTCSFDPGLYLNLGPGRIPYHHRRVLDYCQRFEVALEPYVMETTANLVAPSEVSPRAPAAAQRWHSRRVANDVRGHLAALLVSKLTDADDFTGELRDLLRVFGDLDEAGEYTGSTRSGYMQDPEVHDFPQPMPPLDFRELVESRFWKYGFYQPVDYMWQPTLFQPVGGMDQIVNAFTRQLEQQFGLGITLGAEVTDVTLPDEGGVVVEYVHDGEARSLDADYCVSNIPLPVLRGMGLNNFSPEFTDAIAAVGFAATCKVGWQANRRFWEDDTNQIYGGISRTSHVISQLWYPSNDYFSEKGTLTGAYNTGRNAQYLGSLRPKQRLEAARKGAVALHEEFGNTSVVPDDKGVTIAWHKVPYQLGGWAGWDPANPDHMVAYKQLLQPEGGGRFLVVGDQASPLPGWQEGAMMSAQYVVGQILGLLPLTVPEVVRVPDAKALTDGLT